MRWSDWAHVMCSTRGHWLPGDPRGFRSRQHRIHSSGDYRSPPPKGEHAGLHSYVSSVAKPTVRLTPSERVIIGERVIEKLSSMGVLVAAVALDAVHMHALLRAGHHDAVSILGRAKQAGSHAARHTQPGSIWGRSSHVVRITSREHGATVQRYILAHRNAWTWSHEEQT